MIFIPIIQIVLFCLSVGTQIKDMPIVIKNDEINLLDCQSFNGNGCIFDDDNHQNMSCVILQYLKSLDYKLVNNLYTLMSKNNSVDFTIIAFTFYISMINNTQY